MRRYRLALDPQAVVAQSATDGWREDEATVNRDQLFSGAGRVAFAAVLVVPLAIVVYGANAAGDHEVSIYDAIQEDDRQLIVRTVCLASQRLRPEVQESTQTVTVTITALDYSRANGQDCIGVRVVDLASPLDDRRVIDGSSGRPVTVQISR